MNLDTVSEYDVAVVGGGAAGLSAALVLVRALRKVVVVDAGVPRNALASHMHGFISRDGIPPHELLATGRGEVVRYGGDVIDETVTRVRSRAGRMFEVSLVSGRQLTAPRDRGDRSS